MKIATLLYIRNSSNEYLLIERNNEPNKGLLSPPGGKVKKNLAESPAGCAVREAKEECGLITLTSDWRLRGIVTEKNYPGIGNIMIFCYLYKKPTDKLPSSMREGKFRFIPLSKIYDYKLPETDKLYIWKFVLDEKIDLFSIRIDCSDLNNLTCVIEH
ncbi:MAG: NUDIX domain-containing protein [Ignavibacteria bacterium]|nr:NUDIX domain-containing protein [Ignavibacteria bacterium]